MKENKNKKKISPKAYSKLLKCIDLNDIYLKQIKANISKKEFTGKANLSLAEKAIVADMSESSATIEMKYEIRAKANRKNLFVIYCSYIVTFNTDKQIPPEFFEIYNKYSLPLQTFPYFRELVNTTISRMGLPPLIMPLRKFLIDTK